MLKCNCESVSDKKTYVAVKYTYIVLCKDFSMQKWKLCQNPLKNLFVIPKCVKKTNSNRVII